MVITFLIGFAADSVFDSTLLAVEAVAAEVNATRDAMSTTDIFIVARMQPALATSIAE